jgi:hypothetical protein
MPSKKNNPKKTQEELKFEQELKKLKLSAEHGAPFLDPKKAKDDDFLFETDDDFLTRMRAIEDAIQHPNEKTIGELLGYPKFPKIQDLADDEIGAALEMVTIALANENIYIDFLYPTPEREIYRFITEEVMVHEAGMAGVGGMNTHLIYEEFYPNYAGDIESDIHDLLHFLCRGYKGHLPWRIADKVKLYGKNVDQEEFEAVMADHRHVFRGMNFIAVDSVETKINKTKAHAVAAFRFYMDKSTGQPGEIVAKAEFYFKHNGDAYLLNRLVIDQFGIK